MNPWVFTLPHGEGKELNLDSLAYEESNDFFEENNHPGRYEDRKVQHVLVWQQNLSGGCFDVPFVNYYFCMLVTC